jgi:hypothetical protein
MTRIWLAALIGLMFTFSLAGAPGFHGQCAGGTLEGISKSFAKFHMAGNEEFVFYCGKEQFRIPYGRINTVEYGQDVSRRYAAAVLISPVLLLSKERRHYVTLNFTDRNGMQQAVVFRVEKTDIRSVLAGLEARTGRRVEYQDGEARKGGI